MQRSFNSAAHRNLTVTFLTHPAAAAISGPPFRPDVTASPHASPRALAIAELCLLAVLAVQAGRLLWGVLAPVPGIALPLATVGPATPAAGAATDPFFPDASLAAPAPGAGQAWTLHGVRIESGRGDGAAIIAPAAGTQSAYRVGDALAPGVVLQAVAADHVLLLRGSATLRLDLPADDGAAVTAAAATLPSAAPAAPPVPAQGTAAQAEIDPQRLLAAARLRAHREDGRVAGYALMPGGDEALLRQAGLQPGDVLLDVNGRALDPGRLLELADELRQEPRARITFRRDGQTRTLDLGAPPP